MPNGAKLPGNIPIAIPKFELGKFLAGLVGPFFRQIWKTYKTAIGKLMAYGAVWSFRAGMSIRPDMMRNTFFNTFDKFLTYDTEWTQAVRAYFHFVTGVDPGPIDTEVAGQMLSENIGEHFLTPMLNMVLPGGWRGEPTGKGLSPEDGLDGAEKFLGVNMRFQMQSWLMDFITDFMGVEGARSITNLPQNISWAYGIGWLSWLVMGVPFRLAISEPLERYFQLRFRTKDLTLSQIADFYWTDPASREGMVQRLKELGYTDDDIPRLLNRERKKLSKADLAIFRKYANMTQPEMADELIASGYSPADADVLSHAMLAEPKQKLIEDIARAAERQYKAKTLTEPDLRGYLALAGHDEDEISLIISRLELEKLEPPEAEPRQIGLTRAMVGGLYKRGERDRSWVLLKLAELNWDSEEIDDFLDYYKPDREKEEGKKSLTANMIGRLYKRGWITQAKAEQLWQEIQVRPSHIPLYVKYYTRPWDVPAELPPLRLLSPDSVGQMYKQGVVSQSEAVRMLREGGLAQADAELYLELFTPSGEGPGEPGPGLNIWDIATACKQGTIDHAEAVTKFVQRGWDAGEARIFLTTYGCPE